MNYNDLKMPNHLAIIVDGNGRWAQERGKSRSMGHKAGADNLNKISKYAFSRGVKILSIFVFSTENFKRSEEEVNYLMDLFVTSFNRNFSKLKNENVKIVFSGRKEPLPNKVLKAMNKLVEETKNNNGHILNICLNYGGQSEIVDAAKKISYDVVNNKLTIEEIDEQLFSKYLYNYLDPIDLLIRTSGELRISNFMLWQLSYAEFYFTKTYFPAFDEEAFNTAILDYNKRDRRFGGIKYENKNH